MIKVLTWTEHNLISLLIPVNFILKVIHVHHIGRKEEVQILCNWLIMFATTETENWSSSHPTARHLSTLSAQESLKYNKVHFRAYFSEQAPRLQAMRASSTIWADCLLPCAGASSFLWGCTASTVHCYLSVFNLVYVSMHQIQASAGKGEEKPPENGVQAQSLHLSHPHLETD